MALGPSPILKHPPKHRTTHEVALGAVGQSIDDRRLNRRYPVNSRVEYTIVGSVVSGSGSMVNISRGGVLFRTADALPLPLGSQIALSIAWPGELTLAAALNLQVIGEVVRRHGNCTAARIRRCDFARRRCDVWQDNHDLPARRFDLN